MAGVEQFLAPGENVRFTSPSPVRFQGDFYTLLITDRRILWHKTRGLIVKKNNFVAIPIEQVKNIGYQERGLVKRQAFITIDMANKNYEFGGSLEAMKAVYGELQSYQMMDRQLHKPPQ